MKLKLFILSCIIIGIQFSYGNNLYQNIDKATFYSVMKSGNLEEINNELSKIGTVSFKEKQAYEGALLMRKAGLLKKAKDKLRVFKEGGKLLETAITNDNNNAEYRFLRLTIQEHAPKILKYNKQIDNDRKFVTTHFNTLQPTIQQAVRDYAQSSKVLSSHNFN